MASPRLGVVEFEGWDYLEPPPPGIEDELNLASDDPWVELACIFERAKRGDFSAATRLPELWQRNTGVVAGNAQTLFAYIADADALAAFDDEITAPDARCRAECADAATLSGSLRFVSVFVAGYRAAFGETTRMAMEEGLHNLLCSDPDVDATTPLLGEGPEGERVLATMAEEKAERFGTGTSLFEGEPLRASALVASVWRAVEANETTSVELAVSRLQAMIGFTQDGLFAKDRTVANVPAIRALLDRIDLDALDDGVRYFFGHRAPL